MEKSTLTFGHKLPQIKRTAVEPMRILMKVRSDTFCHFVREWQSSFQLTHLSDGDPAPFNTQFFQDDYDDGPGFDGPGFDDDGEGIVPEEDLGEQDLLAQTQNQKRRVRPEVMNYAKRAKRVDVRKLKDNIWRGLDIIVPPKEEDQEKDEDEMVHFSLITLACVPSTLIVQYTGCRLKSTAHGSFRSTTI